MSNGDAEFEAINACVERILASDSFSRSPQARHFLRYVVDGARKKDSEGLKAYTIGVHALGATGERSKPETTARMQAGRVRRLLAKYYEGEGKDEALELRLPTRRYAPEYIPRRTKSAPPAVESTLAYELPTLYIGSFESHSQESQDLLFCRALAEEVTELLVETDGLAVSDAAPRDQNEANALILTASISRVDRQLRVVSRLRSLDGQQMLWSDHFDAELSEGGTLQVLDTLAQLLASQVGDSVHGAFLRIIHRNEAASLGYRGVQRALRYLASPTSAQLDEVIAALESSLQTASDQALVHAMYANLLALRCLRTGSSRGSDLLSSEAHAQSALDLDPECAWAHFAKAQVHYHHREPSSAERELSLALSCERASVTIQALAGNLYCLLGVWPRGVELIRQAQARQSRLSGYLGLGLCLHYFFEKSDPERAEQVAQDCQLKETLWGAVLQVCCLGLLGRRVEARQLIARIIQKSPNLSKTLSKHLHEILLQSELANALVTGAGEAGLLPRYDSPPQSVRLSIAASRARLPREIRVGILHSLSGPMAISEPHLVNAAMLAIEEINSQGGLLGRPMRGIIKDGCSDPQIFKQRAEELIIQEGVVGIFGCWMSSSRKAVLPVVERHSSLLWYPVQYEGLEGSRNIVYTGSCLNQQVEPGVRWAIRKGRTSSFLVGSDYVYPRTVNRLIRGLVTAAQGEVTGERYQKVGAGDFEAIVQEIQLKRPDIVYNTLNGADNVAFFKALRKAGITPEQSLVMSFSLSELELSRCGDLAEGHLAVASYFQSMATSENKEIVERFRRRYGQDTVLSDPSVTAYAQLHLYKEVVEKAASLETEAILHHLPKCRLQLGGEVLEMQSNNHAERRAIIGRIVANRQFQVLWRSNRQITPQPWLGVEESDLKTRELVLQALRALPEIAEQSSPLESHAARN